MQLSLKRPQFSHLVRAAALAVVAGGLFGLAGAGVHHAAAQSATTIDWNANAKSYHDKTGQRFTLVCPASTGFDTVWGTDVYTDDSSICTAGVHAGAITTSGGAVTIEMRAGQSSYRGSTRNGVTTRDWGSWGASYVLVTRVATPPSNPPVQPPAQSGERLLGGINVANYCAAYFAGAQLGSDGVWYCVYTDVFGYTVSFDPNMSDMCQWQYGTYAAYARETRSNDPLSWGCFVRV